jgi:hypothetical protein
MLGTAILLLVLVFPQGVIGALDRAMQYLRQRRIARAAAQ